MKFCFLFFLIVSKLSFAGQAAPFLLNLEECKKEFRERNIELTTRDNSQKLDGESHRSFYLKSAAPKKDVPAEFSTPNVILDISIAHDDGKNYMLREKQSWRSVGRDEFCQFLIKKSKKCNKCLLMRWDGCC